MATALPDADSAPSPGILVAVIGPSGAGKDSVIAAARSRLQDMPQISFVRRLITRPADPSEPYESVSPADFHRMQSNGGFALSWHANGLGYALPLSIEQDLARGHVMVANLSREAVPQARGRFPSMVVVHITASVDTLRQRIAARGRETDEERELRIQRSAKLEGAVKADALISNDGLLEEAVSRFVSLLAGLSR
jgi:ribose 1,5-bisphosphokinase